MTVDYNSRSHSLWNVMINLINATYVESKLINTVQKLHSTGNLGKLCLWRCWSKRQIRIKLRYYNSGNYVIHFCFWKDGLYSAPSTMPALFCGVHRLRPCCFFGGFFQVPFWKSYYTLEILLRLVLFSCQKNPHILQYNHNMNIVPRNVAVTLFINQFHSPVGRYAARGSVCSCCGCRLWGTTVLKSSSLFLPVWYQDFLLCPPLEGPVPLTPSFITLSPLPLMVDIITFLKKTIWSPRSS